MTNDENEIREEDFVTRNWKILLTAFAGLIVILLIGNLWSSQREKNKKEQVIAIYKFRQDVLKKAKNDEIKSDVFWKKWKDFRKGLDYEVELVPLVLDVAEIVKNSKNNSSEIQSWLLDEYKKISGKNTYMRFILLNFVSSYLEDQSQYKEAIGVIETFLGSAKKEFAPKFYFDLGRLYKKIGNVDKSKHNFRFLMENYPNEKWSTWAKVLMEGV